MKAVLALVLVALLVVCAQSMIALPRGGGFIRPRWNPKQFKPWNLKRKAVAAPVAEDDEESDFWMALAPLAINLIKNKLTKKRDDFDEEADFINLKKVWGVAKNIGKSYLSSKYGINLDEEEEADSEFLSKLKNWWNSKGKDLAIKGLQIYSQIKNGGAQQGDDEEEEADFINWKKIGSIAKDIGKNYLSTKYGINLDEEEEESDFINWKKVWGTAKDIGKSYLSSKYGINLDEEEESDQNRAFDFGANVNGRNWNVNAGLTGQTRNGGSYNVGGNFGNGGQWGVNGGYDRTWNNGRTSFGGNAGYGSGGFNAGVKFTHRFDDVEESDFINWKKVWGVAKDIGKNYLSTKYGVNLDEEEEADFNWLLAAKVAAKVFKPRPAY